jgi:lipopolysaccharide transport system ATP-binding protein
LEKKSGGREKGESDEKQHYRKGKAGDWKEHFTREVTEIFLREAGPLASDVGYSPTERHLQSMNE